MPVHDGGDGGDGGDDDDGVGVISNYNDDNHPLLCLFLICLLCW